MSAGSPRGYREWCNHMWHNAWCGDFLELISAAHDNSSQQECEDWVKAPAQFRHWIFFFPFESTVSSHCFGCIIQQLQSISMQLSLGRFEAAHFSGTYRDKCRVKDSENSQVLLPWEYPPLHSLLPSGIWCSHIILISTLLYAFSIHRGYGVPSIFNRKPPIYVSGWKLIASDMGTDNGMQTLRQS